MIRYLAVLGVFMFMALWFLGEDHGQFINPPAPQTVAAVTTPQRRSLFIPAKPLPVEAAVSPDVTAEPAAPAVPEPVPVVALATRLMQVPGGASVRSGPGSTFPIVGSLAAGGVVMVADDASAPGWVRIQVDGLGEGWVWSKLLRE